MEHLSPAGRRAVEQHGARAPRRPLNEWLRERRHKGAAVRGVAYDELMVEVDEQRSERHVLEPGG